MKNIYFTSILLLFCSCNLRQRLDSQNAAKNDADFIISNLESDSVYAHFPAASFSAAETKKNIGTIRNNCDWSNRKGNFVDYTTISNNGENDIAFIYEYFLKCDSLRFILIYNIDEKTPRLFKLNIESLKKQSPMVIHTEKQLLKYKDH